MIVHVVQQGSWHLPLTMATQAALQMGGNTARALRQQHAGGRQLTDQCAAGHAPNNCSIWRLRKQSPAQHNASIGRFLTTEDDLLVLFEALDRNVARERRDVCSAHAVQEARILASIYNESLCFLCAHRLRLEHRHLRLLSRVRHGDGRVDA
eukprot:1733564-Prymnesium_polylepis.1